MSGGCGGHGGGIGWTGSSHNNVVGASISRYRAQKSILDSTEEMLKANGIKPLKRPSWFKRVRWALSPRKAVLTFSGEPGVMLPVGAIMSDGNQQLEVVGIVSANMVKVRAIGKWRGRCLSFKAAVHLWFARFL